MSEQVHFETPEDVALAFDLAGPASRLAAAFLDYLLLLLLFLALVLVLISAGVIALGWREVFDAQAWSRLSSFTVAVLLGTGYGLHTLYFVLLEWRFSGQTPGKKALGLRVVRDGGYSLGFGSAFLRNLLRPVDMMPGFYVVGLLAVLLSGQKKRIGDQVAGTLVVRHDHAPAPTLRFAGESYARLERPTFTFDRAALLALPKGTLGLLDGYFDRAEALDPSRRAALAKGVAGPLGKKLGASLEGQEETFLKELYLALRGLAGP